MDLVIDDNSNVDAVFFSMSEDNLRKQIAQPWMAFGSDGKSMAPEGVFLKSATHPRAYGNFARLLGKYVRDEQVITLEEAVRRLTSLPAANMKIEKRGRSGARTVPADGAGTAVRPARALASIRLARRQPIVFTEGNQGNPVRVKTF